MQTVTITLSRETLQTLIDAARHGAEERGRDADDFRCYNESDHAADTEEDCERWHAAAEEVLALTAG